MHYKDCLLYHCTDTFLSNQELLSLKFPSLVCGVNFSSVTLSRPNYPEHYFASNTLGILEEKQLAAWKRKPQKLHKASLIP